MAEKPENVPINVSSIAFNLVISNKIQAYSNDNIKNIYDIKIKNIMMICNDDEETQSKNIKSRSFRACACNATVL